MSIEHIRALVREAGPALAADAVWESSADGPWALRLSSGTTVLVEYLAAVDRLWLCADVGTPRPEHRARLYETMLIYNAQWQQTEGVRLALDRPGGKILQAFDVTVTGLTLPTFRTIVQNFVNAAEAWSTVAAGGLEEAVAAEAHDVFPPPGIIRG